MESTTQTFGLAMRPELIALGILVVGVIVARVVSLAAGALLELLDRRAARVAVTDKSVLSPKLIRVTRIFVFWLIVTLSVLAALRIMGIGGPSDIVDTVLAFTPRIFVAFSIIVAGHLVGLIAAHLLTRLSEDSSEDSVGPRMLHLGILVVAIVMGLQHVNVDISFITRLILILVATISAGLMLAFALGARQHVANLLARAELVRVSIGERVRIDDIEGTVVDVHATGIDVAVDDGIASIPAARLAESGLVRLKETDHDA